MNPSYTRQHAGEWEAQCAEDEKQVLQLTKKPLDILPKFKYNIKN